MTWPIQLSQSSTKGFLWYITFWAFLPSEQSLTVWVKLTKGHHNYLKLSRHHLYWNEPVVKYNTAGIVKPTTVFSWPNNGAGKVSETCTFIGLKNTPEMWVIPTISCNNTEHSLLMMAVRHGQKLQYQKTWDRSSLESIFQIQFQGEHSWNYTCFGFKDRRHWICCFVS